MNNISLSEALEAHYGRKVTVHSIRTITVDPLVLEVQIQVEGEALSKTFVSINK